MRLAQVAWSATLTSGGARPGSGSPAPRSNDFAVMPGRALPVTDEQNW